MLLVFFTSAKAGIIKKTKKKLSLRNYTFDDLNRNQ